MSWKQFSFLPLTGHVMMNKAIFISLSIHLYICSGNNTNKYTLWVSILVVIKCPVMDIFNRSTKQTKRQFFKWDHKTLKQGKAKLPEIATANMEGKILQGQSS